MYLLQIKIILYNQTQFGYKVAFWRIKNWLWGSNFLYFYTGNSFFLNKSSRSGLFFDKIFFLEGGSIFHWPSEASEPAILRDNHRIKFYCQKNRFHLANIWTQGQVRHNIYVIYKIWWYIHGQYHAI